MCSFENTIGQYEVEIVNLNFNFPLRSKPEIYTPLLGISRLVLHDTK